MTDCDETVYEYDEMLMRRTKSRKINKKKFRVKGRENAEKENNVIIKRVYVYEMRRTTILL